MHLKGDDAAAVSNASNLMSRKYVYYLHYTVYCIFAGTYLCSEKECSPKQGIHFSRTKCHMIHFISNQKKKKHTRIQRTDMAGGCVCVGGWGGWGLWGMCCVGGPVLLQISPFHTKLKSIIPIVSSLINRENRKYYEVRQHHTFC